MKKIFSILIYTILFFVILSIIGDIFNISSYSISYYVDLNSGEIKIERYIFHHQIKPTILETDFSKEIRRLGINVPDDRIWKYMSGIDYGLIYFGTRISDSIFYGRIAVYLKNLKYAFELYNISDNDRMLIIEEALRCIKNEDPDEAMQGLGDIIQKLNDSNSEKNRGLSPI